MNSGRTRERLALVVGALFAVSGTAHLVKPEIFAPLMPEALPASTELIYISGVLEIVAGYGLARERQWAKPLSVGLLLAVWPANFTHARRITKRYGLRSIPAAVSWVRMPLQIPMIWAVAGAKSQGHGGTHDAASPFSDI